MNRFIKEIVLGFYRRRIKRAGRVDKETIKYMDVSYTLCDSEGLGIVSDSYDVYNMAPGDVAYVASSGYEGVSVSKSRVELDIDQEYIQDEMPQLTQSYKKGSNDKITFTVENSSSKDAFIWNVTVLYKDAEGNIVAADSESLKESVEAGGNTTFSVDGPVYLEEYDGHKAGEAIDYASCEVYYSGYADEI